MFIDENRDHLSAADLAYLTDLDEEFLTELSETSYRSISVNRRDKHIFLLSASIYGDSLIEMANAKALDKFAENCPGLRTSTSVYMWGNCLLLDFDVLALMDNEDKAYILDLVHLANEFGIWDDDIYNQLAEEWWQEYGLGVIQSMDLGLSHDQITELAEVVWTRDNIWVAEEGWLDEAAVRELAASLFPNA